MGKTNVICFNHVDEGLSQDEVRMLSQYYHTTHHRCWCYKQLFHSFKRKDLALYLSSYVLVAVGAGVGVFINPVALAVTGLGVVLNALTKKKNYPKKVEACRFAYTSYQKELNTLKGYIRGMDFSEEWTLARTFCALNSPDWMTSSPICVLLFQAN